MLFLKTMIIQQKVKFEYGYKFNEKRMQRQKILLPITEDNSPDWQFMEEYMRRKETLLSLIPQHYYKLNFLST